MAYADTYLMIVTASIPFIAVYNAGAAIFRVQGNSAISMKISMLMNGINVAGNAILVLGLHCGVEGVAIPTLVSRIVAAVLMVVCFLTKNLPYICQRICGFGLTGAWWEEYCGSESPMVSKIVCFSWENWFFSV